MTRRAVKRASPEDAIQTDIVENAMKTGLREGIVYFAVPNGGFRHWQTAISLKDTGVISGIPDLVLIDNAGRAYFLEVKTPSGRLSDSQIAFRDHCAVRDIPWALVRSRIEAIEALRRWRLLKDEYL